MNNIVFRSLRAVILALLLASTVWASKDSLVVDVMGVKSPVGVWWPAETKKAPVLVWFHGGMTSSDCEKGLIAGDDLSKLYPTAIVVSASACRENHWATAQMVSVVDYALDSLAVARKIPIENVSLVGVSDGAIGVFFYSLNGRRHVQDRLLISSNGSIMGDASKLASWEKFKEGRWRFLQGGSDRLYPSNITIPWIDTFCKSIKSDCDMRFDPAGEHDWSYWQNKRLQWIQDAISVKKK